MSPLPPFLTSDRPRPRRLRLEQLAREAGAVDVFAEGRNKNSTGGKTSCFLINSI